MAEAMSKPAPSSAERMDVFLTEQELEHRLVSSCGECIDDDPCQNCVVLLAHDAALRARAEKAEEAKDALYESFKELTAMDQHSAFRADAAEARVLSLETERASWKTAAEDQNTWLAAHNRAVAAFNVAIGDAQDAVLRAETLGKALRELIRAWRDYPGCYDESPEPDKEMEALCKNATAVLEGTP
jgi:hypothetical protein